MVRIKILCIIAALALGFCTLSSCKEQDCCDNNITVETIEPVFFYNQMVVLGGRILGDFNDRNVIAGVILGSEDSLEFGNAFDVFLSKTISERDFLCTLNLEQYLYLDNFYYKAFVSNSATPFIIEQSYIFSDVASVVVSNTINDIEGNLYKIVKIGNVYWMAENLRTTKYNDGTNIPGGFDDYDWTQQRNKGAFSVYPHELIDGLNSEAEVLVAYGALYNAAAIRSGKLCPTGWEVSGRNEWEALINFVKPGVGGKLKSFRVAPSVHPRWDSPNVGASDAFGFSALPGGIRWGYDGSFYDIGVLGYWFEYSYNETMVSVIQIFNDNANFSDTYISDVAGLSVRCIKRN